MLTDELRVGEINHGNNVIFGVDKVNAVLVGHVAQLPDLQTLASARFLRNLCHKTRPAYRVLNELKL
jgi:hypothetical protein